MTSLPPLPPLFPILDQSSDWFVVRITGAGSTDEYFFAEVWDSGTGALTDKPGGRFSEANNPAIAVLGTSFSTDDIALCRNAEGRGGVTGGELYPIGSDGAPGPQGRPGRVGPPGLDGGDGEWFPIVLPARPPSPPSPPTYGDVIGPDCARTGQVALFNDPSGRFIAPSQSLRYHEFTNTVGGGAVLDRSRLAVLMPGAEDDPLNTIVSSLNTFLYSNNPEWGVATSTLSDPINPLTGNLPPGATESSVHQSANQFIRVAADGVRREGVSASGGECFEYMAFSPTGGLCFVEKRYDFDQIGTAFREVVWYDAVALEAVKYFSYQVWMRHFTRTGVPGISATCTVKVGGVDKTMTITDGIVVSIV